MANRELLLSTRAVRAGCIVLLVLSGALVRAQTGATTVTRRFVDIPAAARDARLEVVKKSNIAGQLVFDAAKIGAAASPVVASDLAGNSMPVARTSDGRFAVIQDAAKWIVVKPSQSTPTKMQAGLQWLPGVCVPPTSNAGTAAGDTFSSYVDFQTVPVAWDTEVDAYRVDGLVGVAKNGDQRLGGDLGKSAVVKFSFEGVRDPVAPDCSLARIGIDGEQPVDLRFDGTATANPTLIVRSSVADVQKYLMDVRPRLAIEPTSDPILGLGLEKTTVYVRALRADDSLLLLSGNVAVAIVCSGGRAEGAEKLAISDVENRPGFTVRSMGLGALHLVASASTSNQALNGSVTIRQVMPWGQVLAALLGGALGGYARRFVKGARSRVTGRRVMEGVVVGLVAFVAGVLGVGFFSFPQVIVATVAGAFLTGVAAGFAGVTLFEKLGAPKTAD